MYSCLISSNSFISLFNLILQFYKFGHLKPLQIVSLVFLIGSHHSQEFPYSLAQVGLGSSCTLPAQPLDQLFKNTWFLSVDLENALWLSLVGSKVLILF